MVVFRKTIIQSGEVIMDKSHGWKDGHMSKGSGYRESLNFIKFDTPFDCIPNIIINLSMIDSGDKTLIVNVIVKDVKNDGFTAVFFTWNVSKIHGAAASWIAIGE